ncbi:hypothetical protein HRI_000041000 [Hibiscus trionum]|uniref:Uncharacterized protein n=1 Tax=Hibiscus trionum TaxID=183268 RepID=A0A9W7GRG1_HIBTR|nr:hypothetical protein HRI_000041000 [Hibiscus trionum]
MPIVIVETWNSEPLVDNGQYFQYYYFNFHLLHLVHVLEAEVNATDIFKGSLSRGGGECYRYFQRETFPYHSSLI